MTPEQFQRVEGLFHEVKELSDNQRRSFLASACDDQIVRDEVLRLLEHARTPMNVRKVQSDAARVLDGLTATPDIAIGTCIGPYRIVKFLDEGGMGLVYLAEQNAPIHRRVALKLIKLGMDTKQTLARFETEREALALMNHPNVAKVFDAGATELGRPYFVMEYVAGIPITEYCDKHRLNTEERLCLFMDVCNAIQHAHQKGIIHRDIKPSNVLVAVQDEKPTPKVIDFGVAKATQHRLTERTLFTEHGQFIGTPGYMSPEQAEMTALDIDTRTDVYSLGVLLYELLIGAMPFDTEALLQRGFAEIQRIIREVDPPKPSTRLSALGSEPVGSAPRTIADDRGPHSGPYGRSSIGDIAHHRHTEPKTLIRQLRGDLDWIVMRAMEKDRTHRYATANGLALEIQRHLNNQPVLAGPPSMNYRLRKFVRRNRGPVIAVTSAILLVASLLAAGYFQVKARQKEISGLLESAKASKSLNNWDEADAAVSLALSKDPGDSLSLLTSAWLKLEYFEAHPEAGDESLLAAEKAVRQVLDQDPGNAYAHNYLGVVLRRSGRYDEAVERHIRACELDPLDFSYASNLGVAYAGAKDLVNAAQWLKKGAELAGIDKEEGCYRATAWRNRGVLELYLKQPESFQHIENARECCNADVTTWLLRALAKLELPSQHDLKAAREYAGTADGLSDSKDAKTKRILALACLRNGDYEKAVSEAKEAIRLKDQATVNCLLIAVAEAKRGRVAAAKGALVKAEAAWPEKLRNPGDYTASAETSVLWIESADDLIRLKAEAETAIAAAPGSPP